MVDLLVPLIFKHLEFNGRSGVLRYRDLSNHEFEGPEKDYLVSQILCKDPELRSIDHFDDSGRDKATFILCKRYCLVISTVKNWIHSIVKLKKKNSSSSAGRPFAIDGTSEINIKAKLIAQEAAVEPLSKELFNILMVEEKILSQKRKFVDPDNDASHITIHNTSIDRKTIKNTQKNCDFRTRIPQTITNARLAAMSCARLIYITAVIVWALARFLPKENKWNADCTTFICSANTTGQLVVVFREKGERHRQVTTHLAVEELNVLVKYFLIGNAAGQLGDPCFIVAVPNMPENKFYVEYVLGLSNNDRIDQSGWIYFCKTKGGNAAHSYSCRY